LGHGGVRRIRDPSLKYHYVILKGKPYGGVTVKIFENRKLSRVLSTMAGLLVLGVFPSAAIAGDKDVVVINDDSTPVPVEDVNNPSRRPIQRYVDVMNTLDPVSGESGVKTIMTVPSDSRLVIEFVSASCNSPVANSSDRPMEASVLRITTSVDHYFSFDYSKYTDAAGEVTSITSTATHLTRLYAEPGTEVRALISPTSNRATLDCNVSISGYLTNP